MKMPSCGVHVLHYNEPVYLVYLMGDLCFHMECDIDCLVYLMGDLCFHMECDIACYLMGDLCFHMECDIDCSDKQNCTALVMWVCYITD